MVAFAVVWTGFALFWMLGAGAMGGSWFSLFGLPFVAVGIAMLAWALGPSIAGLKIGEPEVTLPTALRVGEEFTVGLKQTARREVVIENLSIRFLFRESATYRRGTDTYTDTHEEVIQEITCAGKRCAPGDVLTERHTLRVPPDGMHTFVAPNNKLRWLVQLHIALPGWPDFREEYEVTVLPERVAS